MYQLMHLPLLTLTDIPRHSFRRCKLPSSGGGGGGRLMWSSLDHPLGSGAEHLNSLTKLTPWSRGLLEKLTVSQLVKKCPAFYGTRRIITEFTIARNLSLSWARSIQFMSSHPTSRISILILSSLKYTYHEHKYQCCLINCVAGAQYPPIRLINNFQLELGSWKESTLTHGLERILW
jgi:hypothetical protein